MPKRILAGGLAAFAVAFQLALASTPGAREELTEEFHQTYPLRAGGRVSLDNINGDVRVSVWDREEVKVDAVKSAFSEDRLADIEIKVSAQPDAVHIRTEYRRQHLHDNPGGVDYTLTVPRRARLDEFELVNGNLEIEDVEGEVRASSVNGRVETRGLSGEVHLSVVNGHLEATFDRPEISKPITLDSVNGQVILTLPGDASADLSASTVMGGIHNDFGLRSDRSGFIGHDLHGVLGKGGARIELSDVNGSIEIRRASGVTN